MKALFGKRLREQRKMNGWTLEQFAEKAGISPNYIGDIERGKKLPSLETFIHIVEVLGVSADALIRDSVVPASYVADHELNSKLQQLTPKQKKAAVDILNVYIENLPYIINE